MSGASVAYELADAGSVLVLEAETSPGYHSTGRSAALLPGTTAALSCARSTPPARPFLRHPRTVFARRPF
ncbi:FAD-dependent oxidoreductase [Tateyamaria armeniaca]|uniref:FAD-dependent oxidoreductase n=1 Tax=Tateyamaria armeniaca TaxID=2518930 RepID=A0ABW8UY71_9RHOB